MQARAGDLIGSCAARSGQMQVLHLVAASIGQADGAVPAKQQGLRRLPSARQTAEECAPLASPSHSAPALPAATRCLPRGQTASRCARGLVLAAARTAGYSLQRCQKSATACVAAALRWAEAALRAAPARPRYLCVCRAASHPARSSRCTGKTRNWCRAGQSTRTSYAVAKRRLSSLYRKAAARYQRVLCISVSAPNAAAIARRGTQAGERFILAGSRAAGRTRSSMPMTLM